MSEEMPPLDVRRLLLVLADHRVKYVVIGGVAALLQDVPMPPTLDLDITPERTPDNLERLAAALEEMEAKVRGMQVDEGVEIPLDARMLANMQIMTFVTKYGPFDVSINPDGTKGYRDLRKHAVELGTFGIMVPVASVEDIIRSKEAANREKDAPHLVILYAFLRSLGER